MSKAARGSSGKVLNKSDWERLIRELHGCTELSQLKAWSAYAASFNMPEVKRNELLSIYKSHRESLSKKSEVA
jgi:hypothetical protein